MNKLTRDYVDTKYGITLTDNQWAIIQAELADKDDDETDQFVIEDVIANLDSYEQEYAWWLSLQNK